MIRARFFIGDEPIEYDFDETVALNNAVDHLSMLYYEKKGILPLSIFMSPDLYSIMMKQNVRYTTQLPMYGMNVTQFLCSMGTVTVQVVREPKERFIYAGNEQGYQDALIDKKFEELVLGINDET